MNRPDNRVTAYLDTALGYFRKSGGDPARKDDVALIGEQVSIALDAVTARLARLEAPPAPAAPAPLHRVLSDAEVLSLRRVLGEADAEKVLAFIGAEVAPDGFDAVASCRDEQAPAPGMDEALVDAVARAIHEGASQGQVGWRGWDELDTARIPYRRGAAAVLALLSAKGLLLREDARASVDTILSHHRHNGNIPTADLAKHVLIVARVSS